MIFCVWYPSGGFGHYINGILNLYGKGFIRPTNQLSFSAGGDSHNLDYVAPRYFHNQDYYDFEFNNNFNYSIIVDNGINSEDKKFQKFFPDATIIKICYTDFSWPIIANTLITKAMQSNFESEITFDLSGWDNCDNWAIREKYFLFLRDHPLRFAWRSDSRCHNIHVENLFDYYTLTQNISNAGVELNDFSTIHQEWLTKNNMYFNPVQIAYNFVNNEKFNMVIDDLWTQAIVYYLIWCQHGVEVPHNNFANFFSSRDEFQHWLDQAI